jgi:tetratricopeptide (TPR) repeat protein
MEDKAMLTPPDGALTLRHLDGQDWVFEYARLTDQACDEFHEAIDLWEMGELAPAEEAYRRLGRTYPEFIDVHHHLAILLDETGRCQEAFQLWQDAVALGLRHFPIDLYTERGLLPWMYLENRPFLRAYHGLGLEYVERGRTRQALEIFHHILDLNPDDNQGVRALVVDCNLRLKRPGAVLEVCQRYPDDGMEQLVYGRALAFYQLGMKREARAALRRAIEIYPLIAAELLKPRHRPPKDLRADRITLGGADQAYWYWREQGRYWKRASGALDLLAECLAK